MRYTDLLRGLVLAVGLTAVWQAIVWLTGAPHYILPGPLPVFGALATVAEHNSAL